MASSLHESPLVNPDSDLAELSRACMALWTATLSLMAAFMHTSAPAHRYLIARRIARNLATLRGQECFNASSRQSFDRLSRRWTEKADRLDPGAQRPRRGIASFFTGLFQR